jgi:uncharacterized protein
MYGSELPLLSPTEVRVLGTLMEKAKATPDYYPMTINAITAGCNQRTSRLPVMNLTESEVSEALSRLKALSLVATAVGAGSRTIKYKHNFNTVFDLPDAAVAILCLLFLRGPQTPGELNSNSGRLHDFSSIESIVETLSSLKSSSPPMVTELQRAPGQKEQRYTHLFSDTISVQPLETVASQPANALEIRVAELERELEEVKAKLDKIMRELF